MAQEERLPARAASSSLSVELQSFPHHLFLAHRSTEASSTPEGRPGKQQRLFQPKPFLSVSTYTKRVTRALSLSQLWLVLSENGREAERPRDERAAAAEWKGRES